MRVAQRTPLPQIAIQRLAADDAQCPKQEPNRRAQENIAQTNENKSYRVFCDSRQEFLWIAEIAIESDKTCGRIHQNAKEIDQQQSSR